MQVLDGYVAHLTRRNLRPTYVRAQLCTLKRLATFLDPIPLERATGPMLTAYLDSRPLSPAARGVETVHLRVFYAWCVDEGHTTNDPARKIVQPRRPRCVPRPMNDSDAARALASPPRREGLILNLALYAGLRGCEIAQLRGEDFTRELITIRESKGGHTRIVPIAPPLAVFLDGYGLPAGWLFPKSTGGHLGPGSICQIANRYLHSLGIGGTLHQLRHTFGTNVYRTTRDLRVTQELMGHRSIQTTEGYTQLAPHAGQAALTATFGRAELPG